MRSRELRSERRGPSKPRPGRAGTTTTGSDLALRKSWRSFETLPPQATKPGGAGLPKEEASSYLKTK